MKTSAFLDKTKVVELEILYNSSVNGAPDQLLNDGLCPKYFLIYVFFWNFTLMLGGPWAPRNRLINFGGGPWAPWGAHRGPIYGPT